MNILYLVTKLDRSDKAEDVIRATRFLALNGHKPVVLSRGGKRVRKIDEVGARHYTIALRPNVFSILADIFRVSQIISKENIRIVHAMDGISSFIAFFAARIKERVFISTIYEHNRQNFLDRARMWAKRIICFSESEIRNFARDGVFLQGKVCLIPPSVSASMPVRDKPLSREGFVIGATLPLSSEGATLSFVKAISILRRTTSKIKVFIIGSRGERLKAKEEKLKLLLTRHSLGDMVTILPGKKEHELIPKSDLFVQVNPVCKDGTGLDEEIVARPLLDAAAWGIPVLTTDAPWLSDYVEYDKTAIVCRPGNAEEMAAKILDLYKNKEQRTEIADIARNFVKEAFNVKKMMEATLRLYEEALASLNILIIKTGALGDVILAIPSIRAIREKFPRAKIKLLTAIDKREIFVNSPLINDIIICDFKGRDRGIKGLFGIARKLRYEDFDIVIDLQNNKKSHILSFLSSAPRRYGYDNGKLSFLLNRKIRDTKSVFDPVSHQSRVLGLLGIYSVDKRPKMWVSKEDEEWADRFLASHWVQNKTKLVAINLGSSRRWVTKLWPAEYFADLANALARDFGVRIILIGSEEKGRQTEEFLKRARCKPINALGKTTLPGLAALLKRCDSVVSSDSAPLHVAAGVNAPFVALFGPTDPQKHLAPAGKYVVFKKDFKCSPCYKTHCKRGNRCMGSIKPDEVYRAIVKFIK